MLRHRMGIMRGEPIGDPAVDCRLARPGDQWQAQTSTAAAQITSHAVKAYGVAAKARLSILPDVPTLTEEGLPLVFSIWQGLYAPAGTPQAIITRLSVSLQHVVESDSVKAKLAPLGVTAGRRTWNRQPGGG
jgi:tripartite-type tricarboxylate transporter receptor subunit TctC